MIDKHSQTSHGNDEELGTKGVMVRVVRGLKLDEDEVYGGIGGDKKHYFHEGIIRGHKISEEVKIACCEDECKQTLAPTRYSWKKKNWHASLE